MKAFYKSSQQRTYMFSRSACAMISDGFSCMDDLEFIFLYVNCDFRWRYWDLRTSCLQFFNCEGNKKLI